MTSKSASKVASDLKKSEEELILAKKRADEEYAAARREMEQQLLAFRAQQEKALSVFREKLESLKDTMFILEENIFALRSLFGETFTLVQLSSGVSSKAPLVLHQKFRFCDEEFALLAAREFGKFDGNHGTITEIFKKKNVQDVFLPSEKCITFFRVSKDNRYFTYDADVDGLTALEYYHGNQIGMLIRNGDNVWLSFIDEEVFVKDNLFESPSSHAEATKRLDSLDKVDAKNDAVVVGETKLRDPVVKAWMNKIQLFNVLRGLISCTQIFPELKGVDILNAPSNLLVLSAADNQLSMSKYPSFDDYFDSWRFYAGDLRVGDPILIVSRSAASKMSVYSNSEIHRSRGYENRARDAEDIETGINKISFIESEDEFYELLVDKAPYKTASENGGKPWYYRRKVDQSDMGKPNVVCEPKYTFYISAARHPFDLYRMDAWGNLPKRVNRVNLRVENDEFCPLLWVNSNYVKSWMEQKNLGNWNHGNYVYLVEKCFHAALKFLLEREAQAVKLIQAYLPSFVGSPDELDKLIEWQREKVVRVITNYQAKRFASWYKGLLEVK